MINDKFKTIGRVVLKEEFMALTKGEIIDSLLLNQFVYWLPKLSCGIDNYIKEEQKREYKTTRKEAYKTQIHLTEGWMYKTAGEFAEELFLNEANRRRIDSALARLIEKGWVERRRNPYIAYDRTYQYRVNLRKLKTDLNAIGYELQGYQFLDNIAPVSSDQNPLFPMQKESSNESIAYNDTSANLLKNTNSQNAIIYLQNARAIPETTTENKKREDEKISLQKDLDISEQRSGQTTKDISDNKIKPDYKPRITIEEKIKKAYKCSDGAYDMALKEFILYNQEKDNESLNWDNLFERWCLNRAQWRENLPINKNTDPSGISPSERVQNNVTKRLNEFERNIFSYLASILEPNEYISNGFLLLKLEYVIEGRIRFSHIARDVCDILIAKYMDKIKLAVQAFRPDITDYEIVAKS